MSLKSENVVIPNKRLKGVDGSEGPWLP